MWNKRVLIAMKKIYILFLVVCLSFPITAQEIQRLENASEIKMVNPKFHIGLDFQSKYIWRGMEMMTENSSPVLFPTMSYSHNGLYAYVMGGYAINGVYNEVDMGVSYSHKWLSIALNDYYYPTTTIAYDNYFDFCRKTTGHWLEGAITISPENIPGYIVISNFFYGADKNLKGEQAYSTYLELGAHYDFLADDRLVLAVGAALNESCYNNYEKGFGICNVELKYTHTLQFTNEWSLPLNVSYIINPIREKAFVNFSTSFAF